MKASTFLALRYIKVQKKHSLFIVICVALSVALTAFSLIAFSTVTRFSKQAAERTYGSWEAYIGGLTDEQAEALSRNAAFSEAQIVPYPVVDRDMIQDDEFILEDDVWYSYLLKIMVNGKTDVSASSIADISLLPEQISSGRIPENENEIAVNRDSSFDIGDTVTVSVQYVKRHFETDRSDSRVDEILDSKTKTYTVTGRAAEDEIYGDKIYCFPQDDFFTTGMLMRRNALFVKFTDPTVNYRTEIMEICEKAGVQLTSVADVSGEYHFTADYAYLSNMCFLNNEYNLAAAAGSEARADLLAWSALMYVVVLLILAAGRMIIDCEFELTSAKMHKQLGLLMSVGASDRQLVEITVIQGLILGIVAVPLGLLLGYLFAAAALYALMSDGSIYYFEQTAGTIRLSVDPVLMLLAGITGIGWVFFSAYGTAVRIKKVNPTEAVRGMRKKGKLPYPKRKASENITPKGFIKAMALSTMKIERKRFIVSTIAMTVSIVFFVVITFGVNFAQSFLMSAFEDRGGGLGSYEAFSINRQMSQKEIKELAAQINGSGYFRVNNIEIVGEPYFTGYATTDELLGIHPDYGYEIYASYVAHIYPITRAHYDALFADIGITYDEAIENRNAFKISGEGEYEGKVPDSLTLSTVTTNSRMFREEDGNTFDINIISLPNADENDIRTTYSRWVSQNGYSGIYYCYMPEEILYDYIEDFKDEELTFNRLSFALNDIGEYLDALEWLDENIPYHCENGYSEFSSISAALRIITVIGYAVIIVAALIAISNIVNITVSGITENRQGFALLKAAGMDDGQIEKTAVIQSLYPAADAALAALLICSLLIFAFFFSQYSGNVRKSLAGLYEELNPFFHPLNEMLFALRQYIIASVSAAAVSLLAGIGPIKEIENAPIAEAVKAEE